MRRVLVTVAMHPYDAQHGCARSGESRCNVVGDRLGRRQQTTIALAVFAAVPICSIAARALGEAKDPQAIVLDEIVALPIAYVGVWQRSPAIWVAGFLLFRLFDISKPFPARHAERLPAGWGIVADDCIAAGYACLALHALLWLDRVLNLVWLTTA